MKKLMKSEKKSMAIKSYIWDLDGTLLDSYQAIVTSLLAVARENAVNDSFDTVMKAAKGGSVSAYLRQLAAACRQDESILKQRYWEISHERLRDISLVPGAIETLEALKRAGARHFVYTHRGSSTLPLLERLGLKDYFVEIVTFEHGFQPKPSGDGVSYLVRKYGLDRKQTAYVGDRSLDVLCAKDAGVAAILYCPEDSCVIPSGNEDLVIRHLTELTEM